MTLCNVNWIDGAKNFLYYRTILNDMRFDIDEQWTNNVLETKLCAKLTVVMRAWYSNVNLL